MKPEKLQKRGEALWTAVTEAADLDPAGLLLLGEACRTADIVERLNGALSSKHAEWLRLSEEVEELADGAVEIRLVINPLLGEIRQQRLALRQMIAHLKLGVSQKRPESSQVKSIFDRLMEEEFPT